MITTISQMLEALRAVPQDLPVYIDNQTPSALSSYRGYYDQLAIELGDSGSASTALDDPGEPFELNMAGYGTYVPGHAEVSIKSGPTVADLAHALNLAIGARFEGYKGGQFRMDSDTDLWVSQYGQCDRKRVSGIEVLAGRVDLLTTVDDSW